MTHRSKLLNEPSSNITSDITLTEIARPVSLGMTAKDLKAADRLGAQVGDPADIQQVAMAAVLLLSHYVEVEKEYALEELADGLG